MPYYIFKITDGITPLVKNYSAIDNFASFSEAKKLSRELRSSGDFGSDTTIKVIFADNALQAEELLQEKREPTIVKEWEK